MTTQKYMRMKSRPVKKWHIVQYSSYILSSNNVIFYYFQTMNRFHYVGISFLLAQVITPLTLRQFRNHSENSFHRGSLNVK